MINCWTQASNFVPFSENLQKILAVMLTKDIFLSTSHDGKNCSNLGVLLSLNVLHRVVRRSIGINSRLNFKPSFFIPMIKSLFGTIFSILCREFNNHILDKQIILNFLLKLWDLKSDFTLILDYPNSALNNLILEYKRLPVNFQEIWTKKLRVLFINYPASQKRKLTKLPIVS